MDLNQILAKAGDHLVVGRAFGPPVEKDGVVLIPVAIVAGGGGGGQGTGDAQQGEGGGFGGLVYPLGVYSIRGGQAGFVPAVNVTRIITATLFMVRVIVRSRMKVTVVKGSSARRRCARVARAS